MKKFVALSMSIGFALLMFVGLPLFIYYRLDRHASARIGAGAVLVEEGGRHLLAYPLEESHATSSSKGGIHSTSGSYAQLVDMDHGRLLWSRRLKAPDSSGRDYGDGLLLGYAPGHVFFLRNALYIFAVDDGRRIEGTGRLQALTSDNALKRLVWHQQRNALAVLDQQGRGWWVDARTLAVRAEPVMEPAMLAGPMAVNENGLTDEIKEPRGDERLRASGAVDADGQWWLMTSAQGQQALSAGMLMGEGEDLDLRRRLIHGHLDWRKDLAARFEVVSKQDFLDGVLLIDPRADKQQGWELPQFQADAPSDDLRRRREQYADSLRELQRRGGLLSKVGSIWTVGAQQDWLVLHRRSGERDAELLLSALGRDGRVHWTVALGVSGLAQIWRDSAGQLLAQGPALGRDSDRLLRVDLLHGQGIGYGVLDRDTTALPRIASAEGAVQ